MQYYHMQDTVCICYSLKHQGDVKNFAGTLSALTSLSLYCARISVLS